MVFSFLFVFYAAFFLMCVEPCFLLRFYSAWILWGLCTAFASCFCDRLFAAGKGSACTLFFTADFTPCFFVSFATDFFCCFLKMIFSVFLGFYLPVFLSDFCGRFFLRAEQGIF